MTEEEEIDLEVRRIAALPDDKQLEEVTRLYTVLTPGQQAVVRALMIESDWSLRDTN